MSSTDQETAASPRQDEDGVAKGPQTGEEIAAVILHTDSGSGASQDEHWAPNVNDAGRDDAAQP